MAIKFFQKFLNLGRYILGERTVVLPEGGDFDKLKINVDGKKTNNYSVIVESEKIKIKKSGFLSSPSHYAAITEVQGRIEYNIKMSKVERIFTIAIVSALCLAIMVAPIVFAVNLALNGYAEDTAKISALIIAVSIFLLVWLKLICLFLVFQSGIGNPFKVLKKLGVVVGA
ncbi:hypothetical protein A7D25_21290 [Pseudomonas sp. 21C1]|uniref:hypothetical protein n=1 Tax=Pseudomonas TaxID=286 RepID=UPI00084AE1FD|nr:MULTISPECIES: hypothetical protein [Pseudomonas]OEC32999.1 hypothetical protein A7D25_21290 [Pseudomonas sp. 21C1]